MDFFRIKTSGGSKLLNPKHVSSIELETEFEHPSHLDYEARVVFRVNDTIKGRILAEEFDFKGEAIERFATFREQLNMLTE